MVLEAAAALAATWLGVRVLGFRRWKRVLLSLTSGAANPVSATGPCLPDLSRSIVQTEEAAARHLFFKFNCLEQSLALWWLFRKRGIAAELRIGARKEEGRLEAHAWVEIGGAVVNETGEGHLHFLPFDGSVISVETKTSMETPAR
jgi:hypothetical protein